MQKAELYAPPTNDPCAPSLSEGRMRPLRDEDYILDFFTNDSFVELSIRRVMWKTPLSYNTDTYVDFHFLQVTAAAAYHSWASPVGLASVWMFFCVSSAPG